MLVGIAIFALSVMCPLSAFAQGLTNPSFEEPKIEKGVFKFVENLSGWQTTDEVFEVWGTGFEDVEAFDGNQFVELNAKIDGTLYQDSTGIEKGATLEFIFAHRGRNGEDIMELTITDLGADNALGGDDDKVLFKKQYTTGKENWQVYDSTKESKIEALGNTVRFAYTAVHGTGGNGPDKTEGNFLDLANFGVGVVATTTSTTSSSSVSNVLEVPVYAQQTSMWCWAATGEMIMEYLGKPVTQCKQADKHFNRTDCCNSPVPKESIHGHYAEFSKHGFTSTGSGTPLTFEQIKQQIDAKQPIAFNWEWKNGTGRHWMVLTGYGTFASVPLVKIHDPGPWNSDKTKDPAIHEKWMTYSQWLETSTHKFTWNDYNIKKK